MTVAIAITTGEPAGIGPEIAIRLAQREWPAKLIFLASPELLLSRAKLLGLSIEIQLVRSTSDIPPHQAGKMIVLALELATKCQPGVLDKRNSPYVLEQLKRANDLCLQGSTAAVVTAPVHKGIINDAGIKFSGHTEYFAVNSQSKQVVMLLATAGLRVALATTHLPLKKVPQAITKQLLTQIIQVIHAELIAKFQLQKPKITVLGLNPHAGENGYLGHEEIEVIAPVIHTLQKEGLDILGPVSADTAFGSEKNPASADVILAMYHDQGLPVLKYRGFGKAANITLGLPYIRTSVDHGTALDLAATGKASMESFGYALTEAINMSQRTTQHPN